MTRDKAKQIISYHKELVDRDTSGLLEKDMEYQAIDMAVEALEQKTEKGEWIQFRKSYHAFDITGCKTWAVTYKCNKCGFAMSAIENHGIYRYCPNCGARMLD